MRWSLSFLHWPQPPHNCIRYAPNHRWHLILAYFASSFFFGTFVSSNFDAIQFEVRKTKPKKKSNIRFSLATIIRGERFKDQTSQNRTSSSHSENRKVSFSRRVNHPNETPCRVYWRESQVKSGRELLCTVQRQQQLVHIKEWTTTVKAFDPVSSIPGTPRKWKPERDQRKSCLNFL